MLGVAAARLTPNKIAAPIQPKVKARAHHIQPFHVSIATVAPSLICDDHSRQRGTGFPGLRNDRKTNGVKMTVKAAISFTTFPAPALPCVAYHDARGIPRLNIVDTTPNPAPEPTGVVASFLFDIVFGC